MAIDIDALIRGMAGSATAQAEYKASRDINKPVLTGAARVNDPLYGYTEAEVDAWIKANNFHGRVNERNPEAKTEREQAAFHLAYEQDPVFQKYVQDNRGSSNFLDQLGEHGQNLIDGTGDFIEGAGPTALAMAGMGYGTTLMNAANAGATIAGAAPAGPMAGSGFTGTGPGVATTVAGTGGATNAMLTDSLSGGLTNAIDSSGNPVVPASNTPNIPGSNGFDWTDAAIIGSGLYSDHQSGESYDKATDEIKRQFDINQAALEPWREAGVNALDNLTNFDTDSITNDPMYQHQLGEAQRATERGGSARGFNLSTNMMNDIATTAANTSSNWGNNLWNRQAGLAGVGQAATNTGVNLGANTANTLAGFDINRGSDRNNAVQGTLSNWLTRDYTKNPPGGTGNPFLDFIRQYKY